MELLTAVCHTPEMFEDALTALCGDVLINSLMYRPYNRIDIGIQLYIQIIQSLYGIIR